MTTLDNKHPAHVKFGSLFLPPSRKTDVGWWGGGGGGGVGKLTIPLFHRGHRVCLSVVLECTRMHAMSLSL